MIDADGELPDCTSLDCVAFGIAGVDCAGGVSDRAQGAAQGEDPAEPKTDSDRDGMDDDVCDSADSLRLWDRDNG